MNTTIEISKNYKQTVELTEKLVSKVNDYVNLSIQLFAFPAFKVTPIVALFPLLIFCFAGETVAPLSLVAVTLTVSTPSPM